MASIFSFRVLTDDYPVKVLRMRVEGVEWRSGAPEDTCWSHVSVLLEGLAEGQTETPERYVVWHV